MAEDFLQKYSHFQAQIKNNNNYIFTKNHHASVRNTIKFHNPVRKSCNIVIKTHTHTQSALNRSLNNIYNQK